MKSILLSIKPKWVAKILNGEKTIEVRKKFPKDYKGWVYIYCTKKEHLLETNKGYIATNKPILVGKDCEYTYANDVSGLVVARFYCDKVEETDHMVLEKILKLSYLTIEELGNYIFNRKTGYAIYISQLEIFDKPKELSEFIKWYSIFEKNKKPDVLPDIKLTKAPQNMCYVEVKE